jgi:hypothetical protein
LNQPKDLLRAFFMGISVLLDTKSRELLGWKDTNESKKMNLTLNGSESYYSVMNEQFYDVFEKLVFRSLDKVTDKKPRVRRVPLTRNTYKFIQELGEENRKENFDTYFEVNESNLMSGAAEDANISTIRALFLDFDKKHDQTIPESFEVEPSWVVQTSPGSYHVYWVIEPSRELETFLSFEEYLIGLYKADPKVKNLSRILRCPGTTHIGSGETCKVVFVGKRTDYTMSELADSFSGFNSWRVQRAKEEADALISRQQRDELARERLSSLGVDKGLELSLLANNFEKMVCHQMKQKELDGDKGSRNTAIYGYARQLTKYLICLGHGDDYSLVEDILHSGVAETTLDISDDEFTRQLENGIKDGEKIGMQPGDMEYLLKFIAVPLSDVTREGLGADIQRLGYGISEEHVVWNYRVNKKAYKESLGNALSTIKKRYVAKDGISEDGMPDVMPAAFAWENNPDWWLQIDGQLWEPSFNNGLVQIKGKTYWNTYSDARIEAVEPSEEYIRALNEYLETFIQEEDIDTLLSYAKYAYENPGKRPWFALEFFSEAGGTGKTSVAEQIGRICGPKYSKKANLEKLDGDYSDEFTSSLILRVSEVANRGVASAPRPVITEKLKELIAEDDILSNAKYGSRCMGKMHFMMILTTNNPAAIDHRALASRLYQIKFKCAEGCESRYENERVISAIFEGLDQDTQDGMFAGYLNRYTPQLVIKHRTPAEIKESYKDAIRASDEERLDVHFLEFLKDKGAVSPMLASQMSNYFLLYITGRETTIQSKKTLATAILRSGNTFTYKDIRMGDKTAKHWIWGE